MDLAVKIILGIVQVISFLIFIRIIVEIVIAYSTREQPQLKRHPITGFLYDFTEPFCKPFRLILPSMNLDSSPIIAIGLLQLLSFLVVFLDQNFLKVLAN